jgi:hypothetical protein
MFGTLHSDVKRRHQREPAKSAMATRRSCGDHNHMSCHKNSIWLGNKPKDWHSEPWPESRETRSFQGLRKRDHVWNTNVYFFCLFFASDVTSSKDRKSILDVWDVNVQRFECSTGMFKLTGYLHLRPAAKPTDSLPQPPRAYPPPRHNRRT